MEWIKERDLLIAQTKAFVQSVAGRRQEFTVSPVSAEPTRAENPATVSRPSSIKPPASIEPDEPSNKALPEISTVLVLPQSDVRQEIQNRVAAFQAHQHRFHREREAYFKLVLSRARSEIGNGPDAPPT